VTDGAHRHVADMLPYNTQQGVPITREFLLKLTEVLVEFVRQSNDRNCKVLDFHHPADMLRLLDLDLPDRAVTLQQLIDDCCITLKYQVKTGGYKAYTDGCTQTTPRRSMYEIQQVSLVCHVHKSTECRRYLDLCSARYVETTL
jgi:hypothetical protein